MEQIWTTSIGKQQGIDLLNAHAQWYCNDIEPVTTYPFQNWADTGNDLWKQRNADDNGWIIRGKLSEAYFGLADLSDPLGVAKEYYGSTLPPRHLWVDGKTIGDASSGATARANADVFNLYAVLWGAVNNTNSQIKIYDSSGVLTEKGDSATADFSAHKAISLPDKRGRVGIGLDNMGGTSADVVANDQADIVGGVGGTETHTLTASQIPPHDHDIYNGIRYNNSAPGSGGAKGFAADGPDYTRYKTGLTGGGIPHNNMQPWIACNYIMRY